MNDEFDVVGEQSGDFVDDVAFQEMKKGGAVGRAEHQRIDAKCGRKICNGTGRAVAHSVSATVTSFTAASRPGNTLAGHWSMPSASRARRERRSRRRAGRCPGFPSNRGDFVIRILFLLPVLP